MNRKLMDKSTMYLIISLQKLQLMNLNQFKLVHLNTAIFSSNTEHQVI